MNAASRITAGRIILPLKSYDFAMFGNDAGRMVAWLVPEEQHADHAHHLWVRKKSMTERTVGRESRWICKTVESHDRAGRRGDVNRLEGTSLATGRRGDVNRLQRTHAVGLAGARQRPELNRPQRAVTIHCHHSLSSQGRTPPPFLFRNVNARFLTRFNFSRPTGATKNRPLEPPNRRITHHKPPYLYRLTLYS